MILQRNNNLSVLPFYSNIGEQNHRKAYAYGEAYPLYTPLGNVPPFQILLPHTSTALGGASLERVSDGTLVDITTRMTNAGLQKTSFNTDYDVILFQSESPSNLTTAEGQYVLHVWLADYTEWVSDIFTVVADVSGMILLRWYDYATFEMDGGGIFYAGVFKNTLWLPTLLGKPDYDFTEEGETRDGYFFPEKQISEKRYKCNFLAPEYLCDVMRLIRMSDVVEVIDNYGNQYRCDTFLMTPKWQDQGDLASVDIEFTTDTVAKKVGKGYIYGDNGDFNDDFNNDYYNND